MEDDANAVSPPASAVLFYFGQGHGRFRHVLFRRSSLPRPDQACTEAIHGTHCEYGASCTGDTWCTKSGYQFLLAAPCMEGKCMHFVAVAKPEKEGTGTRNFCVTDDGVIRYKTGGQLGARVTIAECKRWEALQ